MAHFYGEIQGQAGSASRVGSVASGIWGHIRGWHAGVEVCAGIDHGRGRETSDAFYVYATGGSNRRKPDQLIAIVRSEPPYIEVFPPLSKEEDSG